MRHRRLLTCVAISSFGFFLAVSFTRLSAKTDTDLSNAPCCKSFSLKDHNGKKIDTVGLKGKVVFLVFGFVACPDYCPTTLNGIAQVLTSIKADSRQDVKVIFVTLDPERDKPEMLRSFVRSFGSNFVGAYGSVAETKKVASEYRVFFQKVSGLSKGSYTIDHTTGFYLIDKSGTTRQYFASTRAGSLPAEVQKLLLN